MGFFGFLIKDVETSDMHINPQMRTHYYKCEYQKCKEAVLSFLNKNNYKVVNINDKYGEIFVQEAKFHMIISIRKANILNSSVDIKVNVYNLIGAYRPHKLIIKLYEYLDRNLPYVGAGRQS